MPASLTIERVDIKETIKALRRIDPEAAKEFRAGIRDVVKPTVQEIKASYPPAPLSGWRHNWNTGTFAMLPWDVGLARRNVKIKVSARRDQNNVIYISQSYPAAIMYETVSGSTVMGGRVRAKASRNMWPAVDRNAAQITNGIMDLIRKAEATVEKAVR